MKVMTVFKIILGLAVLAPAVGGIAYYAINADNYDFESVCAKTHNRYTNDCENVGKQAYSQASIMELTAKDFGTIIGVAWRKKGSIISSVREKKKRRSEKNAYYYIIGSTKEPGSQYLRAVSETDALTPDEIIKREEELKRKRR